MEKRLLNKNWLPVLPLHKKRALMPILDEERVALCQHFDIERCK